jgi:hypothetical protein
VWACRRKGYRFHRTFLEEVRGGSGRGRTLESCVAAFFAACRVTDYFPHECAMMLVDFCELVLDIKPTAFEGLYWIDPSNTAETYLQRIGY